MRTEGSSIVKYMHSKKKSLFPKLQLRVSIDPSNIILYIWVNWPHDNNFEQITFFIVVTELVFPLASFSMALCHDLFLQLHALS